MSATKFCPGPISRRGFLETGVMQPGRDHWSNSMSVLVTGGGMRTGQVVGSTNAKGEVPKKRRSAAC